MDKQLQAVADSQGNLSATANWLKSTYERMRYAAFALSILGALLAALASQNDGKARLYLALASTAMFTIVSFITLRFLGAGRAQHWVRARGAAEALKREAYKYASRAAPYEDPVASRKLLADEVDKIEKDVEDLVVEQVQTGGGSMPVDTIAPTDYIKRRIDGQIAWFEKEAVECQRKARRMRGFELVLAFATALITGLVGFMEKQPIAGLDFDFAALVAVLTTISGAFIAYIEASRYDFIVTTYRATARRLRLHLAGEPASVQAPSPEWSAYVDRCESILQEESTSWVAKFGKPA